jgi:hypothetical protein
MIEARPLSETTTNAIRLLYSELGAVNTLRFLSQFTVGYGDTAKSVSFCCRTSPSIRSFRRSSSVGTGGHPQAEPVRSGCVRPRPIASCGRRVPLEPPPPAPCVPRCTSATPSHRKPVRELGTMLRWRAGSSPNNGSKLTAHLPSANLLAGRSDRFGATQEAQRI